MAINFFKNVRVFLTTTPDTIYTAPAGFTAIILSCQISNITAAPYSASLSLFDAEDSTETSLITDFSIPGNDAASALTGKLVLEPGQSLIASASNNSTLQMVVSILESQN